MTDGRATAVTLESGDTVATKYVVSNADPRQTFLEAGRRGTAAEAVRQASCSRYSLSHSAFVVFSRPTWISRSLDLAHEVFVPTEWDHEEDKARIAAGRPAGVWIGIP